MTLGELVGIEIQQAELLIEQHGQDKVVPPRQDSHGNHAPQVGEHFALAHKIRGAQLDRHQRQRVSGKLFHIDLTADVQHAVFDEPGCAGTDSHFGEPQIRGDVSKRGAAITQRLDNCQIGFVELGFHDIPMGRGLAKAGIHSQNQYAFCKNFSFKKG